MGVNSLPKTVTRQRRGCDLNPDTSAPESSTLTTRLPSHPEAICLRFVRPSVRTCVCAQRRHSLISLPSTSSCFSFSLHYVHSGNLRLDAHVDISC